MYLHRTFARGISVAAALLALAMLAGGCDKQGPSGHDGDDHAGHDHGKQDAVAAGGHSHPAGTTTCFICDPSKRETGRLWCKEHGRYEDRCWLCHPELQDKGRLYCTEHFLYEDECFLCHPELKQGDQPQTGEAESAAGSGQVAELYCSEHGVPEVQCAICQPDLTGKLEPGESMKVRMPSADSAEKAGIRVGRARLADAAPGIRAFCEVRYNQNTMARITPLAPGIIRNVLHDLGDSVSAGNVLVELHSAEVASAKSAYLAARVELDIRGQTLEREQRLAEQKIGARKDLLEAEAGHRTAQLALKNLRQKLVNLGFTDKEIEQIERDQDTSARLAVRAPFDGTLVERSAVLGEAVELGGELFTIADLSTRWLTLSVPSRYIADIHVGQAVQASFNELPGQSINAQVVWVDTAIDPRSRMLRARALVSEDAARLKIGMFGDARILTDAARPVALVPRDAVQRHGKGTYVFLQDAPDLFALQRVAVGASSGDSVEVVAGLAPDAPLVVGGSFIVMSEFLKSRLGAGCADH